MSAASGLAGCRWLLLDFDGPVCSAFAGYPASAIAKELIAVAARAGVPLVDDLTDPHDVLRTVHAISHSASRTVEVALQLAELKAVELATPTEGIVQLLERCAVTKRSVAIVSNNHGPAVQRYLELRGLTAYVDHVAGRDPHDVQLMKPNPHLLFEAMGAMADVAPHTGFVGDSVSDMEAGHAAGVVTIGYANKPGKEESLTAAGADVVVTKLAALTSQL